MVGLLLIFGAAWIASYCRIGFYPPSQDQIWLTHGCIDWIRPDEKLRQLWKSIDMLWPFDETWKFAGFDGFETHWIPRDFHQRYPNGMTRFTIPLWMPTFLMLIVCYLFIWRKRRQVGICVECDYDLTGNVSGVCPECGTLT